MININNRIIVDLSNVNGLGAKKVSSLILEKLDDNGIEFKVISSAKVKSRFLRKIFNLISRFFVSFKYKNEIILVLGDYPIPFHRRQIVFIQQALLAHDLDKRNIRFLFNNFYFKLFSSQQHFYLFQSDFLKNLIEKKFNLDKKKCNTIRFPIPSICNSGRLPSTMGDYYICLTSDYWYKGNYELIDFWELNIGPKINKKLKVTLSNDGLKNYEFVEFTEQVSKYEVEQLITCSRGIVNNSSIESLYLPAFEAFGCNRAVISRRLEPLLEYFSDSIYVFDDLDEMIDIFVSLESSYKVPSLCIDVNDTEKFFNVIGKL